MLNASGGSQEQEVDPVDYVVAETVFKEIVLNFSSYLDMDSSKSEKKVQNSCRSKSVSSRSSSNYSSRDVRRFRKNFVRFVSVEDLITSEHMEAVLPKESEREIQLRLEAEAEARRERMANELYTHGSVSLGGKRTQYHR